MAFMTIVKCRQTLIGKCEEKRELRTNVAEYRRMYCEEINIH